MSRKNFTHGSLFSGIGGFDLAAEWMGWENIFHCEWNAFGQKVLKHYWPNAISYEDITKTDFTIHRGRIDILTGGFPCQPYSSAGKRLGKEDDRHLWPQMLRAIREIAPSYVVGENVRGLTNWNEGLVFDEVQADLEAQGYEVLPFLLPACSVNAPHRRDRIWFVAYNNGIFQGERGDVESSEQSRYRESLLPTTKERPTPNSNNRRKRRETFEQRRKKYKFEGSTIRSEFATSCTSTNWNYFPTQSPICNGDDGLSDRLDSITFSKWRKESIKAGGNAIVPQVAYQIFKALSL
jgi:DNA (cytosine-5)-methyltransferase 1